MAPDPPKVLISYSHDSPEHARHVLELSERLRKDGVDAQLDQYVAGTPPEGWPRWMLDRLDWAEFVLMVCTETYYRRFRGREEPGIGKGADWEGNLVTVEMYNAKSRTTKFVPVFFDRQGEQFIPEPLRGHTQYLLNSEENYTKLYAFLTGQAGVTPSELGSLKTLARNPVEPLRFESSKEQGQSMGRLHGVPDLPPHYLPREEVLTGVKQKLLSGDANVAITGQGQAVGVQGMGGIGKTVLAAALVHDPEVRQAFPDGVYWLTIGQTPKLLALQNQLLRQLTGSKETLTTEQEGKDALRAALEGRRALIVLDDAWTIDHADAFSVTAPPARLLITTRNNEVLVGLGAEEHRVDVLSPSDALKMLADWVGERNPSELPSQAVEVARECGYLPLALAIIGAMIRLRPGGWDDALTRLKRADLAAIMRAFPGYPFPNLLRSIEVSVEALDKVDQERYLDLAVFPPHQPIPESALRAFWDLDELDTRDCMGRLAARSLARWTGDAAMRLHDLQHDLIFLRRQKELPGLHLRLLQTWNALPKLPDAYAWRWVAYHMVNAGRQDDLRQLLLNFSYLEAKLAASDPNALIADYDYFPEDGDLHLAQSAIRLSAHILIRDAQQFAAQLTGRLLDNDTPQIQALLNKAAKKKAWLWLRPLQSNIMAPGGPLIRTLEGHTDIVWAVAIAWNGQRAASSSNDGTLRVWDIEEGRTVRLLEGHRDRVRAVAITPDGSRVISASDDRTLRVWDSETGQRLYTLPGHTGWINALAITGDGQTAVSASNDRTLRVWDLKTGRALYALEGHRDLVRAVAVTRDGSVALSASDDRTLRVWDLRSRQVLCTLECGTDRVWAIAITADRRRAVAAVDRTLWVWDLEKGRVLRKLEGHLNRINAVCVTPDNRRVLSASDDRTLRMWDLESGDAVLPPLRHLGPVRTTAITLEGRRAVSGSDDGALREWNLESSGAPRVSESHVNRVTGVTASPDGQFAVSASDDRTLWIWNLRSGQALRKLEGHGERICTVKVTSDGTRLVSGSDDYTVRVWDLQSGKALHTLEGHSKRVNDVAVTPDGRLIVSVSDDRTVRVWDLQSGQTVFTLLGHENWIRSIAITPDGSRAVSASDDRTLRVWDLHSGQAIFKLEGHTGGITQVATMMDGHRAISGSRDLTLRLWDLMSGQTVIALDGHSDWVTAVTVTPDGRRAVSAGNEGSLMVWDLKTGQKLRNLGDYRDRVNAVAVTPDGRRAVSASQDGTLRIWSLERAVEIASFSGENSMSCCAFAPDGQTVFAGDDLGRVHFLQLVEADKTKPAPGDAKIQLLHSEDPIIEVPNLQTRIQQPMPTDSKARVFVSHSSKDKPFVRKLVEALKKHLLNVWVDEHEIKVGDSLVGKISEALKDADYLVIVLSKASVSSRWVEQELNAALTNQISGKGVVLPVLLEDCELPMLLRDRLYADFRADFNVGLQALVAAFEHEGESAVDVAPSGPTTAAPASITPARLRENLQGLLNDRMSRTEVGRLWYAVLETPMDDEMGQRSKSDCVIGLLAQAKNRNQLPRLAEELCKIRPDLVGP